MSLPGLGLSLPTTSLTDPTTAPPRTIRINPNTEFRFETAFTQTLTLKLLPTPNASTSGDSASSDAPQNTAEIFGTPLAPSASYSFTGAKSAVFTHHGCTLEVSGESESEYVADETNGAVVANVHFALEHVREEAAARLANRAGAGDVSGGPRVLVLGPEGAGKSSLVKTLTAYAVRSGRCPCVVSLNPHEGMLSPPGCFSAAVFGTGAMLDVEDTAGGGWGTSPVAGPSSTGVRMPVVYHYGYEKVEENMEVTRSLVGRLALAVTSRFEDDEDVKSAGIIVDLAGSVTAEKEGHEVVDHIVSEFSITTILTLGSERLHSDLQRKYGSATSSDEAIHVLKIPSSGGSIPRPSSYLTALQTAQVKNYFFGGTKTPLSPYTQNIDISPSNCPLTVYRLPFVTPTPTNNDTQKKDEDAYGDDFKPGGFTDAAFPTNDQTSHGQLGMLEKVNISSEMSQHILAVKHCAKDASPDTVRDASVMGFLYVVDVDASRMRARVLCPVGGRLPSGPCVLGRWPGAVGGVVG